MPTISAVIITKDKKQAQETKKSVSFADEVITEEHPEIDNYAEVRNKALKKAKSDWVLFVDDDEIVTNSLKNEIKKAVKSKEANGYHLRRNDHFLGRTLKYGETGDVRILRLARKSAGQFERPVHEVWYVEGPVKKLKNPLLHKPHASVSSFLAKINRYSSIEAKYRNKKGRRSTLLHIIVYPIGKFLRNYIWLLGFLDGTPGLIMASMMSFHSFQTWTKLYIMQHQK